MRQILYFYDPDCEGSKRFDIVYNEVAKYNLDGFEFEKFNILDCIEFAEGLNITTTPSVILYEDDFEVDRRNFGMDRNKFLEFIFQ